MALGGLLAGALGGAMSLGTEYLGGLMNVGFQKSLQKHAAALNYQYAEKSARNQPTWNRAGLESAGYNPMLAVQNATAGANSSWTSSGQAQSQNYTDALSSGIANAQSFQRLKNETNQAETQAEANEATAENQRAEASNKRAQNPYISKQLEAEIGKTSAETTKLNSDTEVNKATIENMKSRIALDRYLGELGIKSNLAGVKYSANQAYNASTYKTDVEAETARGMRTDRLPFGIGSTYYDKRTIQRIIEQGYDPNDPKFWHRY